MTHLSFDSPFERRLDLSLDLTCNLASSDIALPFSDTLCRSAQVSERKAALQDSHSFEIIY